MRFIHFCCVFFIAAVVAVNAAEVLVERLPVVTLEEILLDVEQPQPIKQSNDGETEIVFETKEGETEVNSESESDVENETPISDSENADEDEGGSFQRKSLLKGGKGKGCKKRKCRPGGGGRGRCRRGRDGQKKCCKGRNGQRCSTIDWFRILGAGLDFFTFLRLFTQGGAQNFPPVYPGGEYDDY